METNSTNSRFRLSDVVDFCYANRKRRGFKDWSWTEIAGEIVYYDKHNQLHIVSDDQGICGVICISVAARQIFIHQIVCVRQGFPTLVAEWQKRYPDYTLAGLRDGKLKTYTRKNFYGK